SVSLQLSPSTIVADGLSTSTATATVTDTHGNPVSGDNVSITSDRAQVISATTAGSQPGTYQATITSTTTPGTATITATDGTPAPHVSHTATLTQIVGPATNVSVSLNPSTILDDGTSTSTA